jgi:hypothetical protein
MNEIYLLHLKVRSLLKDFSRTPVLHSLEPPAELFAEFVLCRTSLVQANIIVGLSIRSAVAFL